MRVEEFDEFAGEIKQLCATLKHRFTDALAQAYWRALRDVDLEQIQAHVERILLNATGDTKFPKPAQLRDKPRSVAPEANSAETIRCKEQFVSEKLESLAHPEAKWDLLESYLARCDVEEEFGSPAHEARLEFCRAKAKELFDAYGKKWALCSSHSMHVAHRLIPRMLI